MLDVCPFCGRTITIEICDDEGNSVPDSYKDDPFSGLRYWLKHPYYDDCPIYMDEDYIPSTFSTIEEAEECWNKRAI